MVEITALALAELELTKKYETGGIIDYSYSDEMKTVLGTYSTKERALEILDEIQDLLQNAYVGNSCRLVYNMPKE